MGLKNKLISSILLVAVIIFSSFFSAGAIFEKETALEKFYSSEQKLLCISHRGDTEFYPENSLEGVKSALKKGADFVAVNIVKTADGVYFLCEDESLGNVCNAPYESLSQMNAAEAEKYKLYDVYGKETEYKLTSLERLLEKTDSEDGLILDVKPEYKDGVYSVLSEHGALDRVILRVKESSSELVEWAQSKEEKVYVIAVYSGNIIFSTISSVKNMTMAEMPAVQYQSKNYFNVAYGDFFANRYLISENVRAVAVTYSPDLCGQRGDSSDGWNELIKKGYSVIETNNIEAFNEYRKETERLEKAIKELYEKSLAIESDKFSQVSLDNLRKAKAECEALLSGKAFSLDEAQKAYSDLLFALEDMKISTGEVDTRGALNVTAGKVIAAVVVGAALLAGQIFVYKMRRKSK
ncbi:MAG: glycerophosphodiester phosphodiesterase family protein [Clostridia bacterium]|nr:glycerophosphodiester phosphodiesterase family protein [Clostridia bacterium]